MSGPRLFVDAPFAFQLKGGMVYFEIVSGGEEIAGAMTAHTFLGTLANAGKVAKEWEGGPADAAPLKFPRQ